VSVTSHAERAALSIAPALVAIATGHCPAPMHPIADAPRDGTLIDLYAVYPGLPVQIVAHCRWDTGHRLEYGVGAWVEDGDGVIWSDCPFYGPTHWSATRTPLN
jgi:hypothetical protein